MSVTQSTETDGTAYPPISDYGLIGDCHSAALVSTRGSIDWCCLPRFDSDSCFGRLLDWQHGGHWTIAPAHAFRATRQYLAGTLILVTDFVTPQGDVRLTDFFAMRRGGRTRPRREIVRLIEGVRGSVELQARVQPRFDFGEVKPWIYPLDAATFAAVGSNKGLILASDPPCTLAGNHDLVATFTVSEGDRHYQLLQFAPPEELSDLRTSRFRADDPNAHFEETSQWWRDWRDDCARRKLPERQAWCVRPSSSRR